MIGCSWDGIFDAVTSSVVMRFVMGSTVRQMVIPFRTLSGKWSYRFGHKQFCVDAAATGDTCSQFGEAKLGNAVSSMMLNFSVVQCYLCALTLTSVAYNSESNGD